MITELQLLIRLTFFSQDKTFVGKHVDPLWVRTDRWFCLLQVRVTGLLELIPDHAGEVHLEESRRRDFHCPNIKRLKFSFSC